MCGGCLCARSCRPLWSLLIILSAVPFTLHCSQSPAVAVAAGAAAAAAAGKIYPRGNHWAVGHLMGKKSAERLPELQREKHISEYFSSSETTRIRGYECLMEALLQPRVQKPKRPYTTDRLVQLHREQPLRKMSDLLLLALKLQDRDFT
ncbi:gastrin-releasing peptide [Gouania willdenowi]|uniref:gastrin-releasing peptide n=1 Tax=Gouania willdenowi TaxID=441366 RepID=UPI001054DCBA|nr:gastrin-releasing peptide [Gouania willdenowi]